MKKIIFWFFPFFLLIAFVISIFSPTVSMSESISGKVLRIHILANSDTDEDQNLKLKVRDEVLRLSSVMFNDCTDFDEAITISKNNIPLITKCAQRIIQFYGYNYDVRVSLVKEFFDTRIYNGFALPPGVYNALKIEIGQAQGHNWWCVMYPTVCISGCTDDLKKELSDSEIKMIEDKKYIVKFKIIEVYERIKK